MSFPEIGATAPSFNLLNQDGQAVNLQDFKGKKTVVLYFYPKALTPGCTTQACGLRDSKDELQQKNVVVFGISPDPVKKLKQFIDKHELNFDLLSDEDHAIAEQFSRTGSSRFTGRSNRVCIKTRIGTDCTRC